MSIDFAAIKANTNLVNIASQYTEIKHASGDEYYGPCPFCGGDDRFRVFPTHFFCRENPAKGHCGRKGSAIDFIMEIKHVDAKEAANILSGGNLIIEGAPLKPVEHPQNGQVKVWDAE